MTFGLLKYWKAPIVWLKKQHRSKVKGKTFFSSFLTEEIYFLHSSLAKVHISNTTSHISVDLNKNMVSVGIWLTHEAYNIKPKARPK